MAVAPTPLEIYRRAVDEGERRLSASSVELVATGFNAGFTIVFGIATLGILHGLVDARFGSDMAKIAGAAGFGMGLVLLVVSRAELFTENFFDPVATAFDRRSWSFVARLFRLWVIVLVLNLVGGAILVLILSADGVLPNGTQHALRTVAEELAAKRGVAAFANAIVGGALVTLLSFLLQAVNQVLARMVAAFLIGFMLAVAPFSHVVVTAMHLLFGVTAGATVAVGEIAGVIGMAAAGNMVGGLAFVTLTHVAQACGESGGGGSGAATR